MSINDSRYKFVIHIWEKILICPEYTKLLGAYIQVFMHVFYSPALVVDL